MKKNYKIAIGVGVLALLFIAYKKGVFGGSEGGEGGNSVADEETLNTITEQISNAQIFPLNLVEKLQSLINYLRVHFKHLINGLRCD